MRRDEHDADVDHGTTGGSSPTTPRGVNNNNLWTEVQLTHLMRIGVAQCFGLSLFIYFLLRFVTLWAVSFDDFERSVLCVCLRAPRYPATYR